jgi:GDP-L-fucose synthase
MRVNKNVLVTGHSGFLGSHVMNELRRSKKYNIITYSHKTHDLTNWSHVNDIFKRSPNIDIVLHMAGYNGGIKYNLDYPGDIFSKNTAMAVNIFRGCVENGVNNVVSVLASCAWAQPKQDIFIRPEDILLGQPDSTVACHGYAKRNLYLMSKFAREQYGIVANTACITTMFGPGETTDVNRAKVAGAIINRVTNAVDKNIQEIECWGDGSALRQIIYVKDAAYHLVKQLDNKEYSPNPVFISCNENIFSIKELAEKVADVLGYKGNIKWDTSKPNGQHSKCMSHYENNSSKTTDLKQAIIETSEYYRNVNRYMY